MKLVEPFAGLGSYSLWAIATEAERATGRIYRREPPVSRVGSKSGMVQNAMRAFGLNRARWTAIHLNDLCPVMHLLHLLYASSELRDACARKIWSFVPCPSCLPADVEAALEGTLKPTPESCGNRGPVKADCEECGGTGVQDARRLWERIRSEPVPADVVEALAAGPYCQGAQLANKPVVIRPDNNTWQALRGDGRKSEQPENFRPSGLGYDEHSPLPPLSLASRLESLPSGLATLADVTARALFLQSRSFQLKPVTIEAGGWREQGYKGEVDTKIYGAHTHAHGEESPRWTVATRLESLPAGRWVTQGYNPESREAINPGPNTHQMGNYVPRPDLGSRLESLPGPGSCSIRLTRQDAALCLPEGDCSDCVVILDPSYKGDGSKPVTGYAHGSTREADLILAESWHRSGALVLIHESIGLAKDLGKGWNQRCASILRGRKSTFWSEGEEAEWLTANRPIQWWPAQQQNMFEQLQAP